MKKLKQTAGLLLAVLVIGCLLAVPALAADTDVDYAAMDNETAVFTYLTREMGLNTAAACGVMANIQYESGFDSTAWGDGGTSHGLCQWHDGRCANLSSFCERNGYDVDSVYGQMEYLNYELTNSYSSVLEYLLAVEDSADGAYDAAWYWCYYFEVPADRENQAAQRGQVAAGSYYPAYEGAETSDGETLIAEDSGEQEPPAAPAEPRGSRPHHRRPQPM